MFLLSTLKKILKFRKEEILNSSLNDFYQKIGGENFFLYQEMIIIVGILLNKKVINETIEKLKLVWEDNQEKVVIEFAVFGYIFLGREFNNLDLFNKIKLRLNKKHNKIFANTITDLITKYNRNFNLEEILGDDNDRANMFAVNAILNIKIGLSFDNFHITLFAIYQSLELKLKNCLKKYVVLEPAARKKPFNFHNLVRLIKLISTSRVDDEEMAIILANLRENLRYFEKINPGGQAARYETDFGIGFYEQEEFKVVSEKEILQNFIQALSLLQQLYLKIIEVYYSTTNENLDNEWIKTKISPALVAILGIDLNQPGIKIIEKLRNALDQQLFENYDELINTSYEEILILKYLIRIGFFQYTNQAIKEILKNNISNADVNND